MCLQTFLAHFTHKNNWPFKNTVVGGNLETLILFCLQGKSNISKSSQKWCIVFEIEPRLHTATADGSSNIYENKTPISTSFKLNQDYRFILDFNLCFSSHDISHHTLQYQSGQVCSYERDLQT